jgi:alkylation response protein AidB-like acyl-CoA dehydrogenase
MRVPSRRTCWTLITRVRSLARVCGRRLAQYFNNRKLSIFGGSNEIQKNIISKMILGL